MSECRLCGEQTPVIVNVNFKAVHVCDACCLRITKQTVATLTVEAWPDGPKQTRIVEEDER